MEILWLVVCWVLLLYFIRLHREISFYKKILNQHKDIYVPTLSEIMESSTPGRQISSGVFEFIRFSFSSIRMKWNNIFKKGEDQDLPMMVIQHGTEKELKF